MSEQAPSENIEPIMGEYAQVEQKKYKNGAVHVYGVDAETGKRKHISHEEILKAYGHSSDERKQYNAEFDAQEVIDDEESDDMQAELDQEWLDVKDLFAAARQSGNFADLKKAMATYEQFIAQFDGLGEAEAETMFKELNTGEVYEDESLYEADDEKPEPSFSEGTFITWNGELYKVKETGSLTDMGDRSIILEPAYDTSGGLVDTFERTLLEAGAEEADAVSLQRLDFNNGVDAIVANLIAGGITLEEAQAQVTTLGEQTERPKVVIDRVVTNLDVYTKDSPAERAKIEDYEEFFVPEEAESTSEESGAQEVAPEVVNEPKKLRERAQNLVTKPYVKAQIALNDRAANRSGSDSTEKNGKRRWLVVAGLGVAAAAALVVASKYGLMPKFNGDAAQTAQDAAGAAGKHVNKLTHAQEALISAPGKYPYGHYEHVYGADAANQIHKAVRRLHAAGVKVIEHGSGADYWIEVPAKHGGGMTANTKRVVEVLATGRV